MRDFAKHIRVVNSEVENISETPSSAREKYNKAKINGQSLDVIKSIIKGCYNDCRSRFNGLDDKRNDNLYNKSGSGRIDYYNETLKELKEWEKLMKDVGL